MRKKRFVTKLLIFSALFLAVFPVLLTFNDVLTRLAKAFTLYEWMQSFLVPLETKMIAVLVYPFHIKYAPIAGGIMVNGSPAQVTWNCLGWQSMLLLFITFAVGLSGKYTRGSKIETMVIGIIGTFLVNLVRITFIVLMLAYSKRLFAFVFHDYLAAIVTIVWLFGFWWLAERYILEEGQP